MASISARLESMGAVNLLGLSSNEENLEVVTVNNFASFGTTTLADVSILETLNIGTSSVLSITGSSIDSIGSDLSVQGLKQGNISFLGGAIKFEDTGRAIFSEDVEFAKNVSVKGVLSASTVSVTDILLGQGETLVLSDDEVEATSAAGLVTLKKDKSKVKINNPLVKDSSFIFITPKTNTSRTLYLLEQHSEKEDEKAHFVVGIDRENSEDVKFNYLIVN
jgi:hypothetical protein